MTSLLHIYLATRLVLIIVITSFTRIVSPNIVTEKTAIVTAPFVVKKLTLEIFVRLEEVLGENTNELNAAPFARRQNELRSRNADIVAVVNSDESHGQFYWHVFVLNGP